MSLSPYVLQLGFQVSLAIRVCGPLFYQWSSPFIKRLLKQFCCDLAQTLYFSDCFFHLLPFLCVSVVHAVVLKSDWLKSSVLITVLKNKSKQEVKMKEVELRKRCDILKWLTVARALLDTVLSMAISLIKSLLLMSGDVEVNPGPGGIWLCIPVLLALSKCLSLCRSRLQQC